MNWLGWEADIILFPDLGGGVACLDSIGVVGLISPLPPILARFVLLVFPPCASIIVVLTFRSPKTLNPIKNAKTMMTTPKITDKEMMASRAGRAMVFDVALVSLISGTKVTIPTCVCIMTQRQKKAFTRLKVG